MGQLQTFPPEILIYILSYLDVRLLLRCESVCRAFCEVINDSPQLQYQMELEIAGLVDRPSVQLPITERLERLKAHQQRMKDPGCRTGRPDIAWPLKPGGEPPQPFGDILLIAAGSGPPYNTINVGHIQPVTTNGDEPIRWWTIHTPRPFSYLFADPSRDVLVLQDSARLDIIQIISISSGSSVLDSDTLSTPAPNPDLRWDFNSMQMLGDLMLVAFVSNYVMVGITIVGWKDGVIRAHMVFPESVGTSICFVSKTRLLVGGRVSGETTLRMYSFDEPTGEQPSPFTHIATYLLPPTLSSVELYIALSGPKNGAYSKAQRPFTTAEGVSIFSFSLEIYNQITDSCLGRYKLFIHPSAFASFQATQGTQPVIIPWASWGPKLTRIMLAESFGTSFGYNAAYKDNQLNFNTLDIARDLHRARSSAQQDQSSCPQKFFDQDSPTTIAANQTFREDILTYLPYRWWGARSEGGLVVPLEDWVYFTK